MVCRVDRPKVASATVVFAEAVKSNHQLSSKVGRVLAKCLLTRLNSDELFKPYKDLQKEKDDLASKVESITAKKDELAKVVVDLEV